MFDDFEYRSTRAYLPLFIVGGLLIAFLTGRLTPIHVPDTHSYLEYPFGSLTGIGEAIRTPGYPIWLLFFKFTFGLKFVPAAQVVVHSIAAWAMFRELIRWGMGRTHASIVGFTIAIGCTATDNISTISSDALAASVGVMTVTCLLRWIRRGESRWSVILLSVVAIMLRPAYLFLIPWLFVATLLLRKLVDGTWRGAIWPAIQMSGLLLIPLFGWMFFRFAAVGDFGMLPFGHQNLGGILVQLLNDDELQALPGASGEVGSAVVQYKTQYDADVGFAKGDFGATMTIDSRWDNMTYHVLIPAAKSVAVNQKNTTVHRTIADMNKTIVKQYPMRYMKWLAKAARRGAWAIAANIVMHPVFLAAIAGSILLLIARAVGSGFSVESFADSVSLRALTIVTFTYLVTKLGFVVLTSPAIGRFSDAAAIFLPGWIAVVSLSWYLAPPE